MNIVSVAPQLPLGSSSRNYIPVAHVTEDRLTIATLFPAHGIYTTVTKSWADVAAWIKENSTDSVALSGAPVRMISEGNHIVKVDDVPECEGSYFVMGKLTLSLNGLLGQDELADYSVLDFYMSRAAEPYAIMNRLAITQITRAMHPCRARSLYAPDAAKVASVVFPFRPATMSDAALIEVPWGKYRPILLDRTFTQERASRPTSSALVDGLWRADFSAGLTVPAGGALQVSVQLKWNGGECYSWAKDSICARATELSLQAHSGYLPKRKIVTNASGAASFMIRATDLAPGDKIKIKAQAGYFTKVGATEITVI